MKMSGLNRLALTVAAVGFCAAPAAAQDVASFYKGKNVDVYIGYSTGGGYDTYARVLARHMGKHIPGNPAMVPRNMPGAGSLLLANAIANTLPKDGTVFGTVARAAAFEPLFDNPQAKFDPAKLTWIGSMNNEVSICAFWESAGLKSTEQFMTTPLVVGGTGPGADTDNFPLTMNNVLGTKLKLITGYPGGNDVNLAIERGEVQGRCGWSWSSVKSTRPQWLADKKLFIPVQFALEKHADLPNVPLILDLAKNDRQRQILEVVFSGQPMGRPYVAPPGVPADRVKALRDAFNAMMKDPEFLAEADKAKLEIDLVTGEAVEKIVARVTAMPKDVLKEAGEASTKKDNVIIEKK
jgi:tripartite-type tricarboxylate transporter receptor subunit TctC